MKWTVISIADPTADRHARVIARCECGTFAMVEIRNIESGRSTQCKACSNRAKAAKHVTHGAAKGGKPTPEYRAWCGMITRCTNSQRESWDDYGGRGISVSDEWRKSFETFLRDMGPMPSTQHSLDRYPDNDGNYQPGNCRWATAKEQANNRRKRRSKTGATNV